VAASQGHAFESAVRGFTYDVQTGRLREVL
jgi:hypothetical protein